MQSFTDPEIPLECGLDSGVQGASRHTLIVLLRSFELRRNTLWNEPQPCKRPLLANENYIGFDFPFIGSVRRRLRMADAEGLRGNEA